MASGNATAQTAAAPGQPRARPHPTAAGRGRPARLVRPAFLLVGLALLAMLVWRNDPGAIAASLRQLSWRVAIVVAFPIALTVIFDTLGWRYAFGRDRVPFRTLLAAALAGDAFSTTSATIGGEALKAWLLRSRTTLDESVSSLILTNTTATIAQTLFLLLGIVVARGGALPGSPALTGMEALLGIEIVAVAGFVLTQTGGVLGSVGRLVARFRGRGAGRGDTLARVEALLTRFYREEPRRLALSIGWHLGAWLGGAVEAYLILRLLGLPAALGAAIVIEAFGTAVRFLSFLIPASLGAVEGGYVAIFTALGLGPTAALVFGLVKRAREATWVLVGLVLFAVMRVEGDWPALWPATRA